jgi:hypothetical protein
LNYDLAKALEEQRLQDDDSEIVIILPKSLVIHVEEHSSIPDSYRVKIVYADGDNKVYKAPVLKYWKYSSTDLIENHLYPLLPLQLFLLRPKLDQFLKQPGNSGSVEMRRVMLQIENVAEKLADEAVVLRENGKLNGGDFESIMIAIDYLFNYLNERYDVNERLSEERLAYKEII